MSSLPRRGCGWIRGSVFRCENGIQCIELRRPEAAVETQPFVGDLERRGVDPADVRPALNRALYQAGAFQHPDVLGSGRERHPKRCSQLADRSLALHKAAKHRASGRVREGAEHDVQRSRIL